MRVYISNSYVTDMFVLLNESILRIRILNSGVRIRRRTLQNLLGRICMHNLICMSNQLRTGSDLIFGPIFCLGHNL